MKKETLEYETKILEYVDTVDLNIQAEDANSTIKIKYPKRDDDGKAERDNNGNIIYEEKQISQELPEKNNTEPIREKKTQ